MAMAAAFGDDALLYCQEEEEEQEALFPDDAGGVDDLMWDDDELRALFSKQRETSLCLGMDDSRRREAVEWILRINSHYGFSPSTAILAVDYLDRFISSRRYSFQCDDDDDNKPPWMMQLTAVASLSLAAKLEETHVPLLLDFQVEGAKYIFEAKTIQKMELLILSTLKWRMSSVTPLSFIDHCIRRLGLPKTQLFLRRCQNLLLLALPDSRFLWFPPSVLGGAAMIYVIHEGGGSGFFVDQVALASMLRISKDQVWRCYHFLSDISSNTWRLKRKREDSDEELLSMIFKKRRLHEETRRRRTISLRL